MAICNVMVLDWSLYPTYGPYLPGFQWIRCRQTLSRLGREIKTNTDTKNCVHKRFKTLQWLMVHVINFLTRLGYFADSTKCVMINRCCPLVGKEKSEGKNSNFQHDTRSLHTARNTLHATHSTLYNSKAVILPKFSPKRSTFKKKCFKIRQCW